MVEKVDAYLRNGKLFASRADVVKAIDAELGEIVTRQSHKLVQVDKYSQAADYILANLADFAKAHALVQEIAEVPE